MLLQRYHSLDYVSAMPINEGIELINKAYEKQRDEKIFRQWLALLPNMTKQNFISFDDFKRSITGGEILDDRPAEEILKELDELEKQFKRKEPIDGNI